MKKYVFHRQLTVFFGLSYFITWILLVPLILSEYGFLTISPHWHVLGSLGPILAVLITIRISDGNDGLKRYLKLFKLYRVGLYRFFLAVFSPFLLFLISLLIVYLLNMPFPKFEVLLSGDYSLVWMLGSLTSAIAYGFGEEAGWRGFALPRLQEGRSAFKGTSILTIL